MELAPEGVKMAKIGYGWHLGRRDVPVPFPCLSQEAQQSSSSSLVQVAGQYCEASNCRIIVEGLKLSPLQLSRHQDLISSGTMCCKPVF